MKTIYKRWMLYVLGSVLLGAATYSCKKDKNEVSSKIELLSFGPTGASPGDTLRFIGNNLNLVTAINFTGNTAVVDQKEFIQQTGELILLIVPNSVEKGFVTLKTPQGDIVTKTQLNLGVVPVVTAITAKARPGSEVTITGNYLNWVTRVTFANDKAVDSFVSRAIDKLVVKVPENAQTGTLVLSYGGTEPEDLETTDTLHVTLPVATAVTPNPVKHKTNLTITGTDLDLVKKVLFTGMASPDTIFVSQSATQLVVAVPSGAKTGVLTLIAASGVSTVTGMDVAVLLPSVTALNPNPADVGKDLTITGANLDLVTAISFVGVADSVTGFVSQAPGKIVVKVPIGVLKGKLTLMVLNSTLKVESDILDINGGLPPLADFPLAIYTDELQNTFQDWSYTTVHDFNSTANVRQGDKSILAQYADAGYQGLTFHAGTAAATSGYSKLEFSVFGEAGTDGKKLNIVTNGAYDNPYQVTVVQGEWTTFSLSLSDLGSPTAISEIVLQSAGWGGILHIDHVGLR